MPWLHTVHFGRLEYTPASALEFREGLPGYELERSFLLVERPAHHPLVFLQTVNTPGLCFPALPVQVVEPRYEPHISESSLELLGFTRQPKIGGDVVVLV